MLVVAALRTFAWPLAVQIATALAILLLVSATPQSVEWISIAYAVIVGLCVAKLGRPRSGWTLPTVAAAAVAGTLLFLVKGNVGLAVWVVAGFSVALGAWLDRGIRGAVRASALFVAFAVLALPLARIVIGQPIGTLGGDWLRPDRDSCRATAMPWRRRSPGLLGGSGSWSSSCRSARSSR